MLRMKVNRIEWHNKREREWALAYNLPTIEVMGVIMTPTTWETYLSQGNWKTSLTLFGVRLWRVTPSTAYKWWRGKIIGACFHE